MSYEALKNKCFTKGEINDFLLQKALKLKKITLKKSHYCLKKLKNKNCIICNSNNKRRARKILCKEHTNENGEYYHLYFPEKGCRLCKRKKTKLLCK